MRTLIVFAGTLMLGAMGGVAMNHLLSTPARGDSNYSMSAMGAKFVIKTLGQPTAFQTYRIDIGSGDSWYAADGKWVKIGEDAAPGSGVYDVQLIYMSDSKTYAALRTDLATGRAWYFNNVKWTLIGEQ
jgi:hypothetical protein